MDASDAHLENALQEYNEKVNSLEPGGPSEDLLEAYVNRGCILQMMEYHTSAMDDLESAEDIIDFLESQGVEVDDGTYVKAMTTIAAILFDQNADPVEYYDKAAVRLPKVVEGSRHFDRRSLVRLCIEACENLVDCEYPEDAQPYLARGLDLTARGSDAWTLNRRMELMNLSGEINDDLNAPSEAAQSYGEAIDIGMDLLERESLEDPEDLVMSYVMRAEMEADIGMIDSYIHDIGAAITILEHLMEFNRIPDPEILVRLHHDLAGALMKQGNIQEAEKHLMKAMQIGISGASDYINIHAPRDTGGQ